MIEIQICKACEGNGQVLTTKGGGRDFEKSLEPCTQCKQSGRVLNVTFSFQVPYGYQSSTINLNEVNLKIHETISLMKSGIK